MMTNIIELSVVNDAVVVDMLVQQAEVTTEHNAVAVDTAPTVVQGGVGPSAYQLAVANGFVGTEDEWIASLEGPQGGSGPQGATGPQGPAGPPGPGVGGFYHHEQVIPSRDWFVQHDLGFYPAGFLVKDSAGTNIANMIREDVDVNSLWLRSEYSFGGSADFS